MRTTGPAQPAEILLDIADQLTRMRIPYAWVGAFASSYYGVPRSTTDADAIIWFESGGTTQRDLIANFRAAGYRVETRRGDAGDPISKAIVAEDAYRNRVDLLIGIRGMAPDAVNRCVSASLMNSAIRIIGAEDLTAMKIFAGGFQDLDDVHVILHVSRKRPRWEV